MDATTNDRLINVLEKRSLSGEDRKSRTSRQSIESCEFISCKEDLDDMLLMKEVDEDPYDIATLLVFSVLLICNIFLPIVLMTVEDSLSENDQIDNFVYNLSLFDLYVIGVSFNFFATTQLQQKYYNLNYILLTIFSFVVYVIVKIALFHRLTSNVFVSIVCVISFCTLVPLLIILFKKNWKTSEYEALKVSEKLLGNDHQSDIENGEIKPKHASFGRLLRLTRPQYWTLFYATIALVISTVAMLANPYFFGKIVNACNTDGSNRDSKHKLNTYTIALVVIFAVGGIATGFRGYLYSVVGERLVKKIRLDLFEKIIHQDMAFFDRNKTGELMNRLAADTTVIQSTLSVNISMGLRSVAQVTVSFILLFVTSWELTLVMMTVVPFIIVVVNIYGRFTKELTTEYQNALASSADTGSESISNARVMRSFGAELLEFNRYLSRLNVTYERGKLKCKAYGGFVGGITILANGAITVVIYYGATQVIDGKMTVGSLTSFILYTIYIALGLGIISGLYAEFMNAVGASERIFQIMDQEPSIPTSGGIWPGDKNKNDSNNPIQSGSDSVGASSGIGSESTSVGDIELRDVTFAYPTRTNVPVLKDFNLTIKPHQTVAIVGGSGSGKSTVLCLLERFYDVNSGSVCIDGVNIKDLDPRYLHQMLSIVPQEPVLFSGTIRSNIIYARQAAAYGNNGTFVGESEIPEEDIIEASKKANAHSFITLFPEGYDTVVGERGIRLSGGQKQRVAIARALLANPKVLLLDEATSALDSESEQLVQDSIYRLMNERTVIVIAHRLSTVRHADMIVVCGPHGHVVESGTHEELISKNGSYAKLISRQLENSNNENHLLQLV